MGRHSKPDPDDEPTGEGLPDESPTQRFGSAGEPDYEPGFGEPTYRDYPEAGYRQPQPDPDVTDHPQRGDDEPTGGTEDYAADDYGDYSDYDDYDDYGDYDAFDDTDEPEPAPGGVGSGPPPRSGPQHSGDWEGGEWTGSHRAVSTGRRGVSIGVIAALIAVVVVVGGFIMWRFFGDALSDRSDVAAARCVDGELTVPVVADPSIAQQIQALAETYNESAAPVGDRCVQLGVTPAESGQVVNGFTGDWPADLGAKPALWIPASSVSEARLEAAVGAETVSDARSLVSTPVVLAVRPQLKAALGEQNWAALPRLQSDPNALAGLDLPGWGALRMALPVTGDGDASYLTAEAVAAAAAPPGAPASEGLGAVNTLLAGQPELPDSKAATAMDALLSAPDPAAAQVHAVATTEQQLYQRASSLPEDAVTSWRPTGPTAMADYPTVLLAGDWLTQEQVTAASEFARFMRKPEQLAELAKAGFRAEGTNPPQSNAVDFAPVSAPLSVGDNALRATLANALTAPAQNPAVTIMLDQSMPTEEGGETRLQNVVVALDARLEALPPASAVGLWTFDGTEGRSEIGLGPLADPLNGRPRSAALSQTLDAQSASGGGAVSFTTLRLVYAEAMTNFRQGQNNSVLVITTGPHTDQTLGGAGLQDYIRGAFDPARPVAVNVIDFGDDADRATWEAVAQATGGGYQNLASSASPELTSAIARFVG